MAVKRAIQAYEVMMGEHPLKQPLPTQQIQQIDPFLLIHHHANYVEPGTDRWNAGVGPHPHRGFSPVTFMWEGGVQHRDSRGNNSVVDDGGVQWMDVGLGIIHSERPPAALCENGGMQEIIQIWINLPKASKQMEPKYIPLQKDEMPEVPMHPDLRVSAGSPIAGGPMGPLKSAYPVSSVHGTSTTAEVAFEVKEGENGLLYLLNGGGRLEGYGMVEEYFLYHLEPGVHVFHPSVATKLLFVSAKPIQEKLETYVRL